MAKKAPRRTAQRILEAAQDLFNRFGEPNVSTTLLSAELGISPGNLYYHYPAKDELVNALFDQHAEALRALLAQARDARDGPDADVFLHALFGCIWSTRFLYRDLNDLLSRNRRLETLFQPLLDEEALAMRQWLGRLREAGTMQIEPADVPALADSMMVVLTSWLSFEYVREPRRALEPAAEQAALARGVRQVLHLLAPYRREPRRLNPAARRLTAVMAS